MDRFTQDTGGNYELDVKGWVGVSNRGNNTDRERREQVFFKEYFHLVAEMRYNVI